MPRPELQAAHLAVLRGERAPRRPAAAAGGSNLRAPLTRFVGRDEELARIAEAAATSRLVTLVGPGGAGKTRLAGEAGAQRLPDAPDGVWLVELAPVAEASGDRPAILAALGLREAALLERAAPGIASSDALHRAARRARRPRARSLVLDNCEHLIGDVAAARRRAARALPARCASWRRAASRWASSASGWSRSRRWPARPGRRRRRGARPSGGRAFADRGAAAAPGFAVDAENVAAVVEICRRLDGLPLAIELAAARLRTLAPDQLARRLDDRFRLLTGGSRTALPRHRTLRAVVDWSWELLTDAERTLAERLAVFPGGVTPQSAVGRRTTASRRRRPRPPRRAGRPLAAAGRRRGGARATGCSRRSASTGSSGWPRRACSTRSATAHAHHFARGRRRARAAACAAAIRSARCTCWTPSARTSSRRCATSPTRGDAGARRAPRRASWCGSRCSPATRPTGWTGSALALQADGDADPAERSFVRSVVAVAEAQDRDAAGDEEAVLADVLAELWRPSTPAAGR